MADIEAVDRSDTETIRAVLHRTYRVDVDAAGTVEQLCTAIWKLERSRFIPPDVWDLLWRFGGRTPQTPGERRFATSAEAFLSPETRIRVYAMSQGLDREEQPLEGVLGSLRNLARCVNDVGRELPLLEQLLLEPQLEPQPQSEPEPRPVVRPSSPPATPRAASPSVPEFTRYFRFALRRAEWGQGEDPGRVQADCVPIVMEPYGFALLGPDRGIRMGVPRAGDLAFAFADPLTRIAAVGHFSGVADLDLARERISESLQRLLLSGQRLRFQRARQETLIERLRSGMHPLAFEMRRVAEEYEKLQVPAGRLQGGLVFFSDAEKGSSSREARPAPARALEDAAKEADLKAEECNVVPAGIADESPLLYDPLAAGLSIGSVTLLSRPALR